eukprot:gene8064-12525_t
MQSLDQELRFSTFTEYKEYNEKKKKKAQKKIKRNRTASLHGEPKEEIVGYVTKRQASEPNLKNLKQRTDLKTDKTEIKVARKMLENEGFSPEKRLTLTSIILALNEIWDEEPDFNLL